MKILRIVLAVIASLILAKIMSARMGLDLEEAVARVQKASENHELMGAETSGDDGPFGAEL
jgi:hypothetical protein